MLKPFLKRIFTKGTFASNVAVLGSGTALGQLSVILAAPILSRLYTPADFGNLQFIVSSALILATFSTLRYEMSIPLPKRDADAYRLVKLSIALATLSSLIVLSFLIWAFLSDYSGAWWQKYSKLSFFIPIILLVEASNATLGYWFMRKSDYKTPSVGKAVMGVGVVSSQLILHALKVLGGMGLVLGQSLGQIFGAGILFKRFKRPQSTLKIKEELQQVAILARKYKDFPLFASWNAGLNTLGRHLPPIMLTWYYQPELVGYYAIGMRLLNIPLNLMSLSVGQVFFQQISKYVKNALPIFPFLRSTALKLTLLGFPGLLLIFFFGADIFKLIFGPNWTAAGEIASILSPYFLVRFITSPLSPIFTLIGKQYVSLIWQAVYTSMTFAIIFWGNRYFDFYGVIWIYSIVSAVMFALFLSMEMIAAHIFDNGMRAGGKTERFN
jgi:lipopolysaccharide exporter